MSAPDLTSGEVGYPGGVTEQFVPFTRSTSDTRLVSASAEETPELLWPNNVAVFDRIRRSDGQSSSVIRAVTQAILAATYKLDDAGVDSEIVAAVRPEIGLGVPGQGRARRRRQGIIWTDHLREVISLAPWLGHAAFEIVYTEASKPYPEQEASGLTRVKHLSKLALRHPRTIVDIEVDRDGGLAGIIQTPNGQPVVGSLAITSSGGTWLINGRGVSRMVDDEIRIEVGRLVMYSFEKEGGDWAGQSILRGSYKHWLIKDVLMRVGAQAVERNGMGFPVVYFDDEADAGAADDALAIATNVRAGEQAGAALPDGKMKLELLGVTGQTIDPLPQIQYHEQAIAKTALAMFLDLGHDAGARSLGDTFVDVFTQSLQAMASWACDVFTEYVIRPWVEEHFGPDAEYPRMVVDALTAESVASADTLATLAGPGLLGAIDEPLVKATRARFGLPPPAPKPAPTAPPAGVGQLVPGGPSAGPGPAGTSAPATGQPAQNVTPGLAAISPPGIPTTGPQARLSADDALERATALMERLIELRTPTTPEA